MSSKNLMINRDARIQFLRNLILRTDKKIKTFRLGKIDSLLLGRPDSFTDQQLDFIEYEIVATIEYFKNKTNHRSEEIEEDLFDAM